MKIIECPRDAMQGIKQFIPTEAKIKYINSLLQVGFDTIDFGSFVSPRAIPQMRDTAEVLNGLDLQHSRSRLLAIVANIQGANDAAGHEAITYLGYPLSLSETFQRRNTNRSIEVAFEDLKRIQEICHTKQKTLIVYLSMGFGNPYGDPYELDYVGEFVERLKGLEVGIISLADTIGVSDVQSISRLFEELIPQYPQIEFGAHLHSKPEEAREKIVAAFTSGCKRIDGVLGGFGGCPMADDDLVGNIATESIVSTLEESGLNLQLNDRLLNTALRLSNKLFHQNILHI